MPRPKRLKMLVADDAAELRLLMKIAFTPNPRIEIVDEASNGQQAVDKTLSLRPDVVLLDVSMPVMDGLQAAAAIRAAVPDICIVMYSGFRSDDLKRKSLDAGADAYLEKTGDLKELEACILRNARERAGVGA